MSTILSNFGKAFGDFLRESKKYGFIRVIPLLGIDSIIASSIALKLFGDNGYDTALSLKPYEEVNEPTLFIDLKPVKCNAPCLSIIYISGEQGVVDEGDKKIIYTDSSVSATLVKTMENYWIVESIEKVLALVGGIERGRDQSREGFIGLEKEIVNELINSKNLIVDAGLRLWGWKRRTLIDMLSITYSPYIPSITGYRDKAYDLISKLGFKEPEKVTAGDLISDPKYIKDLVQELLSILKSVSKRARNPIEVLGRVYFTTLLGHEIDLMDLYGLYLTMLSLGGDALINLFYLPQDIILLEQLLYLYEKYIGDVVKEITENIQTYIINNGLPYINAGIVKRPEVYLKILSELGLLPQHPVKLMSKDGYLYTSYSEILRTNIEYERLLPEQLVLLKG